MEGDIGQRVRLLRAHVRRRPDDESRGRQVGVHREALGQPEVQQLGLVILVEHDVGRLYVAVQELVPVPGIGQRPRDLAANAQSFGLWDRAELEAYLQRQPSDIGHGEVVEALVLPSVVHGDDIRVFQPTRQVDLLQETLDKLRLGRHRLRQHFERDLAVHRQLFGHVDLPHAPLADLALDVEPADGGPRLDGRSRNEEHLATARARGLASARGAIRLQRHVAVWTCELDEHRQVFPHKERTIAVSTVV